MSESDLRRGQGDAKKWWARQYRLLLHKFPRGDNEPWTGSELARATAGRPDGHISSSYHTSLLTEKIENPGFKSLRILSETIGFPLVLWTLPPEEWDDELEVHRIARRLASGRSDSAELASELDHSEYAMVVRTRNLSSTDRDLVIRLIERLETVGAR